MNENKEGTKKKKANAGELPVHIVNSQNVSAQIWKRQSPSGYAYLDFSLTRCYQSLSSGNAGSSKNFFARNKAELMQVIDRACEWISTNEVSQVDEASRAA